MIGVPTTELLKNVEIVPSEIEFRRKQFTFEEDTFINTQVIIMDQTLIIWIGQPGSNMNDLCMSIQV